MRKKNAGAAMEKQGQLIHRGGARAQQVLHT